MGSLEEAKRAINQLGAAGVQIFTPLAGRPIAAQYGVYAPLWRFGMRLADFRAAP